MCSTGTKTRSPPWYSRLMYSRAPPPSSMLRRPWKIPMPWSRWTTSWPVWISSRKAASASLASDRGAGRGRGRWTVPKELVVGEHRQPGPGQCETGWERTVEHRGLPGADRSHPGVQALDRGRTDAGLLERALEPLPWLVSSRIR